MSYEDRRALERTLHDGVQQQLVAMAVGLQLARELCEADPAAVAAALDALQADVHVALEALRELANAIYPPVLTDHGVAEALRAAGVKVDAPPLARRPADVEGAVYFACLGAQAVRLWEEDDALRFAQE